MIEDMLDGGGGTFQANMARAQAETANRNANDAASKVAELEQKVEKTLIICEALWSIVKKSHKLEDSHLVQLMKDIDSADGVLNGRVKKSPPVVCSECNKTVQRGKIKCMYCGHENEISPFRR